ncbi:hypothetical protein, partial [Escherichia coli]
MSAVQRNVDYAVYAFILSSKTPSFFKNDSDDEQIREDKPDKKEEGENNKKERVKENDKKAPKKDKKEESVASKPVDKSIQVDFDRIENRIVALPLPAGPYWNLNGLVPNQLTYQRGGTIGAY